MYCSYFRMIKMYEEEYRSLLKGKCMAFLDPSPLQAVFKNKYNSTQDIFYYFL